MIVCLFVDIVSICAAQTIAKYCLFFVIMSVAAFFAHISFLFLSFFFFFFFSLRRIHRWIFALISFSFAYNFWHFVFFSLRRIRVYRCTARRDHRLSRRVVLRVARQGHVWRSKTAVRLSRLSFVSNINTEETRFDYHSCFDYCRQSNVALKWSLFFCRLPIR
jgi:hypothetical protein